MSSVAKKQCFITKMIVEISNIVLSNEPCLIRASFQQQL